MVAATALVVLTVVVIAAALVIVAVVVAATAAALLVLLMLGGVQRPIQAGGDGICLLLVLQGDSLRAQPSAADGVQHVVQGKRGVATGQGDFLLLGNLQVP